MNNIFKQKARVDGIWQNFSTCFLLYVLCNSVGAPTDICCHFFSPYSASSPIRKLVELREGTDMGVSQNLNSEANDSFYIPRDKIEATILNARKYLEDEVIGKMSKDTIKLCKNEHTDCALWAAAGECDVNPKCKLRNWGQMGYAD